MSERGHPELGNPVANLLELISLSICDDVDDVIQDGGSLVIHHGGRVYQVLVEDLTPDPERGPYPVGVTRGGQIIFSPTRR